MDNHRQMPEKQCYQKPWNPTKITKNRTETTRVSKRSRKTDRPETNAQKQTKAGTVKHRSKRRQARGKGRQRRTLADAHTRSQTRAKPPAEAIDSVHKAHAHRGPDSAAQTTRSTLARKRRRCRGTSGQRRTRPHALTSPSARRAARPRNPETAG